MKRLGEIFLIVGLMLGSALAAEVGPRIELEFPVLNSPIFVGKELERIKAGFTPPVVATYSHGFQTSGQVPTWDKETHAYAWSSIWSAWRMQWFSTSPPLRENPPTFTTGEGFRVLRKSNNGECQAQTGLAVIEIKMQKRGWSLTFWDAENTAPAAEKGWRSPIEGRPYRKRVEWDEVKFDKAKGTREVVTRTYVQGQEGSLTRQMMSDNGKRSQITSENYTGTEILAEKLIAKASLQRIRLQEGWQFEQIISEEERGNDGQWKSEQRSETWEVKPDGTREQIRKQKL